MVDEGQHAVGHDLGEVWGKVQNLEGNFKSLAGQVESGFNRVFEAINVNTEKTERRIADYQREVNTRFESEAVNNRQSSASRSATALQIIGYVLTAFIGLGGLGASIVTVAVTFYTLTKSPVDATFARQDAEIASNNTAIATMAEKTRDRFEAQSNDFIQRQFVLRDYFDKKLENYVPKGQVEAEINPIIERQKANVLRIEQLERENATSIEDRAAIHALITELDKDVHDLRELIRTSVVPRPENENRFLDLQERIDKLFDRLNIVQNNLEAGNKVGDRLNRLSDQVESLTNKFVVVPTFPKYRPSEEPAH